MPRHPAEPERLKSLHRLCVLDTETEERFDDITALAGQICQTPISLVSLVDTDRQWFKSHHGLNLSETDLSRSVCVYAIQTDEVLVIEDTQDDPRTVENPLVTGELNMRFYAGAPLIGSDGLPYGSLCVIDTKPRRLSPEQVSALVRLARQVVHLLEAEITIQEREAALEHAETLKSEIDHRVANSLQQVAVLLRLQARSVKNDEAVAAIEVARKRIEAISSFHRTISAASDGFSVSLSDAIGRMTTDLAAVLPPRVTLEADVPDVQIGARFAIGLAMILNEFVTNSQKYAFPDGRAGRIRVAGDVSDETVSLVIEDDGIGWEGELPDAQSSGIGMRVIEASVETLSGTLDVTGDGGCRMRISFPLSAVRPA